MLGVEIGGGDTSGGETTGDSGTGGTGDSGTSDVVAPGNVVAPTAPAPAPTSAAVVGAEGVPGLIDYNQQYAETVQGRWNINWGNVILGVLIVSLGGGGGVFAYFNERKLRAAGAAAAGQVVPLPAATADGPQAELADLQNQIEKLDPRSRSALRQILREPELANDLLQTLARLDPQLIEEVRRLDRREMTLLVALAEEH